MLITVYADINEKEKKVFLSPISGSFSEEDLDTLKRAGWKGTPSGKLTSGYDTYNATKGLFQATESEDLAVYLKNLAEDSRTQLEAVERYLEEECPFKLFPFQKEWVRWFCDPLQTRYAALNASDCGLGKAQPNEEPVLTPTGWKEIGSLKIGDEIFAGDGSITKVTGVFPQGLKDVYEVEFSDLSKTRCCEDHLWQVQINNIKRKVIKVLPLKEIKDTFITKQGRRHYKLPLITNPIDYPYNNNLTIDPYLLGVLIGDGNTSQRSVRFSTADQEIVDYVTTIIGDKYKIVKSTSNNYDYAISRGRTKRVKAFIDYFRELNLNCLAIDKHIPEQYLRSGYEQRLALFQGLIDTDGYVFECNIEYSTSSGQLAYDMQDLAEGLGCKATVNYRISASQRINYRVYIKCPENFKPCRLTRKLNSYRPKTKYKNMYRYFTKITKLNNKELCTCISVEHPSKLYVTRNHIVTHNTCMTLASVFSVNKEAPLIILCPKNAVGTWIEHLEKFEYPLPVKVGKFEPGMCACILTYESLNPEKKEANPKKRFLEDFLKDIPKGTVLVADEFHKTKTKMALMSKRFRMLFKLVKKKEGKCIALTATPIMSYQDDLKQLLMNLDLFNVTFGKADVFNELYGGTFNWATKKIDWDPKKRNPEEIQKRVKSCIFLRKKKDVIEQLPEKITTYITLDMALGKENNKQLDELLENINNLNQSHISSYQKIRHDLALVKSKLALETIEEYEASEKPIIVFSDFKDPIKDLGKRSGWRCITGETDPADRTKYVKEMNDKKLKGLAITIGAGNNAISLPEIDTALFIDLSLTTGNNYQARNRNDRISNIQEKIHYIYFVTSHPFEKKMYELLLQKEEINTDTFGTL